MSASAVLIWAERVDGSITKSSFELLALGRRLADDLGQPLAAVVLGTKALDQAEQLFACGADRVYLIDNADLDEFHSDRATFALVAAAKEIQPTLLLMPHSDYGAEIAPRVAFRLHSAPAMGCIDGRVQDGNVLLTRTCYGGKAHAEISFRTSPAVATLRPKSQDAPTPDPTRDGEIIELEHVTSAEPSRIRIIERQRKVEQGVMLDEAEIIIAGGRGLGGSEGFSLLEQLSEILDGAVGASRPACDMGWYPLAHQVGISGKTVAPELYIAVGISGADHHIAGCGRSKVLVAINNDPDAPIFSFAHIGIVADYQIIVPELVKVLLT